MSGGNNDATSYVIGQSNCSYCAVGGLVGKGASAIMNDVYFQMGITAPTGAQHSDDGSEGFAMLHAHTTKTKLPGGAKILEYQILGVIDYLLKKGCKAGVLGGTLENMKFMTVEEAVKAVNSLDEGTLFLTLTGENDGMGTGINTLAHWTTGQVQNGKGAYYDYQMKIGNAEVRRTLSRKAGKSLDDTGLTDKPSAPWGVELDDEDGRVLVIVVSK